MGRYKRHKTSRRDRAKKIWRKFHRSGDRAIQAMSKLGDTLRAMRPNSLEETRAFNREYQCSPEFTIKQMSAGVINDTADSLERLKERFPALCEAINKRSI